MNNITKAENHGLIELNHSQFLVEPNAYIKNVTVTWLKNVLETPTSDHNLTNKLTENLLQFGQVEQNAFWELNNSLKHPLEKLIREAGSGELISKSLGELQHTIKKIKPPKQTLWGKFSNMFTLLFSLKNSTWDIWAEAYPIHKKKIIKIKEDLDGFKRQLKRENLSLLKNKTTLQNLTQELENSFDTLSFIEKKACDETLNNPEINSDIHTLLFDDLLPAIQHRLIELQQQLVIARQSVMTWDLFIRQNTTQILNINQAVNTTVNAIDVTASLYILNQNKKFISHNTHANKQGLNEARELIDQALIQMQELKASQDSDLNLKTK